MESARQPAAETGLHPARSVAALLAFVAGFCDAASFVGAGRVFCAHVTGNFVVLAAELALRQGGDGWLKLATFPLFVAAVLGATAWHRSLVSGARPAASIHPLLALEAALLGAAAIVGLLSATFPLGTPIGQRAVVVALLVAGMGVQNAFHRLHPAIGPMTTVMTGNVTQWLVEGLAPAEAARRRVLGGVLLAFAAGCAVGAFSVSRVGFGAIVLPLAVVLVARARLS